MGWLAAPVRTCAKARMVSCVVHSICRSRGRRTCWTCCVGSWWRPRRSWPRSGRRPTAGPVHRPGPGAATRSAGDRADETPAGLRGWKYVHVACTDRLTLLHAGSRSKRTSTRVGSSPASPGSSSATAMPATTTSPPDPAECAAHLLRTRKGVHDSDPVRQQWAEAWPTSADRQDMMAAAAAPGAAHWTRPGQLHPLAYAGRCSSGVRPTPHSKSKPRSWSTVHPRRRTSAVTTTARSGSPKSKRT